MKKKVHKLNLMDNTRFLKEYTRIILFYIIQQKKIKEKKKSMENSCATGS